MRVSAFSGQNSPVRIKYLKIPGDRERDSGLNEESQNFDLRSRFFCKNSGRWEFTVIIGKGKAVPIGMIGLWPGGRIVFLRPLVTPGKAQAHNISSVVKGAGVREKGAK